MFFALALLWVINAKTDPHGTFVHIHFSNKSYKVDKKYPPKIQLIGELVENILWMTLPWL